MARFFRRGKTRFYFLTATPASLTAPTVAEINAGTNLTTAVAEVAGFTFANQPIETPDFGSAYVSRIPGPDQAEDSALTFYEDRTSNPLRTTLAKGVQGYIAMLPGGGSGAAGAPAIGDKVDLFHVEVASTPREISAGNDPARWRCELTVLDAPSIDSTLA